MGVDDGLRLAAVLENVHVHAPFGRWQVIAAITAIEIHLDDVLGLHLVIGNARGGDQEAVIGPYADISRGALVDAFGVHLETGLDHLPAQIEKLQLRHRLLQNSCPARETTARAGFRPEKLMAIDGVSTIAQSSGLFGTGS